MQVSANRMCLSDRVSKAEVEGNMRPVMEAIARGQHVLIYCKQGKNRSVFVGTLVLAAWMGVIRASNHMMMVRSLFKPQ